MILGANGTIASGYKPEIDYTDLYVYYDPGNSASYDPGTNEYVLNDISGNSNPPLDSLLTPPSTPGYSQTSQGYTSLAPAANNDSWANSSAFTFSGGSPWTVIHIAKYTNPDVATYSLKENGVSPAFRFGLKSSNSGYLVSGSENIVGNAAQNGDWKFMAVSNDGNGAGSIWVNKTLTNNLTGAGDLPDSIIIFDNGGAGTPKMEGGPLLIYTRQLTQSEIFYIYDFYYSKFLFAD